MAEIAAELPRARMLASALRLLGDDRLCRIAAAGDSRAFAVIYERHHQALYRYCRSIVGNRDDASDALQSTMAAALRGLAGERREISVKPWLFRIAHNECISLLRKRRPQVAIDEALALEAPERADGATGERLGQLVEDLRALPDAQRGALVMRELCGLRYEQIAAALGGTAATARQAVYEARSALHALMEGRAMDCDDVQRTLSDNDRRVLRGRKLRAHLRACSGCRGFEELMRSRRRDLAAVASPLPATLAAGLLDQALGGSAGGASAGGAAGASSGSIAAGKVALAPGVLKAAAVVAATAAVAGSAVRVASSVDHGRKPHPATPAHASTTAEPVTSGAPVPQAPARDAGLEKPASSRLRQAGAHRGAAKRAHHGHASRHERRHTPHGRGNSDRGPRSHHKPPATLGRSRPTGSQVPQASPAPSAGPSPKRRPKSAPAPKPAKPKSSPPARSKAGGTRGH